MKKALISLVVGIIVAVYPVIVGAVAGPDNLNGSNSESVEAAEEATTVDKTTGDSGNSSSTSNSISTQNSSYNFSEDSNIREEIKNRVLENNPEIGEMTMTEARELVREEATLAVADKLRTSKPEYTPTNADSLARKNQVEDVCEDMIVFSAMISDEALGAKLEAAAKSYLLSEDKVNEAIDRADKRTSFAKFFIGPNYGELAAVNAQIEQNRLRIQEMNQIMVQLQNEADQSELRSEIQTLEAQNTTLQDQLDEEEDVFSLFGWLVKLIKGY